jgi:glycine cleavage system H protein
MTNTNFPKEFRYTKDHEWLEATGTQCKVGVTGYAIEQLGDIVHIELPKVGSAFKAGDSFGTIESTKTVSDLYMPVAGKVVELNQEALSKPELLQEDPYQKGWLVKIALDTPDAVQKLMSHSDYENYLRDAGE